MNPARTLAPAIASGSYKGIWVYLLGPVTGAVLGAWSYVAIQDTDKQTIAKLHRRNSGTEQDVNNEHQCSV